MVELKVRKFGNSLGVVLPKEVINRLRTNDGERLFLIEAAEGSYRLTPYDPAFQKKIKKAEEIMGRYRNTLRALAKLREKNRPGLRGAKFSRSTTVC